MTATNENLLNTLNEFIVYSWPFLLISLQLREVRDSVKKCPDEVIGQLTQVFTTDQPEHIHNVDQVILSIKSLYQRDFDDKVKIPKS